LYAIDGQRRLALGEEQEGRMGILADQGANEPQLVAMQAMNAGRAVLGPPDVDRVGLEVDLLDLDSRSWPVVTSVYLRKQAPASKSRLGLVRVSCPW
jgi:hypothetical protein